ncbi:MAG: hypothetical protein K8H88_20270, partial [Sandaracinaceae bacterium]|nr:hypothetical protein [Sandaracinaceae bacterium]
MKDTLKWIAGGVAAIVVALAIHLSVSFMENLRLGLFAASVPPRVRPAIQGDRADLGRCASSRGH